MSYRGEDRETERRGHREEKLDAAFALLSDARRRFILAYLRDHRRATLDELADVVTGWEESRRGDAIATREKRDQIAVRLHHVDLPKLAAASIIKYDRRLKLAEFVDLPEPVDDFLAAATGWQAEGPESEDRPTDYRRRR